MNSLIYFSFPTVTLKVDTIFKFAVFIIKQIRIQIIQKGKSNNNRALKITIFVFQVKRKNICSRCCVVSEDASDALNFNNLVIK
jgi:hypothetical protein